MPYFRAHHGCEGRWLCQWRLDCRLAVSWQDRTGQAVRDSDSRIRPARARPGGGRRQRRQPIALHCGLLSGQPRGGFGIETATPRCRLPWEGGCVAHGGRGDLAGGPPAAGPCSRRLLQPTPLAPPVSGVALAVSRRCCPKGSPGMVKGWLLTKAPAVVPRFLNPQQLAASAIFLCWWVNPGMRERG